MKTIRPIAAPWLLSALLAGFLQIPQGRAASDRTWTGAGTDNNWNTAANWGGVAPVVYDSLFFSGTNRLNTVNNLTNGIVSNLVFTADAGPFTLSGNSMSLFGDVTNNSQSAQTIALAMTLTNKTSFSINGGELLVTGAIGEGGGSRALAKYGLGTLTFAANNTYTGATTIAAGTLKLDMNAGGKIATPLSFGFATAYDTFNNGVFEVKGSASGSTLATFGTLGLYNRGASKLVVDSNGGAGTALTFSSLSRNGESTLNFNLGANSSVAFTTAPTLSNGVLLYGTVTSEGVTGFATVNGANQVVRLVPTVDFTQDSTNVAINYKTEGNLTISSQKTMSSLTITGAGEMSGAGAIQPEAILMQEGVGDYTFKSPRIGSSKSILIHQYSTTGTLRIEGQLFNDSAAVGLTKTGPGRLLLTGTSTYTGKTFLQGGELQVDGALRKTNGVTVYDGATLSGSGSLGSTTNLSAVLVRAGGTIQGSETGGLDITGSLTLESASHFAMTLGGSGSGTVHVSGTVILGNADLVLNLGSAPLLNQEYTLLTGGISGTFGTLNGGTFGPDQTFNLVYGDASYGFQLVYGADNVLLQVTSIPEPASSALMALAGAGLAFGLRRRAALARR